MRTSVANLLVLLCCVAALGMAGGMAMLALHASSTPATREVTAPVRVNLNDTGGSAELLTLKPIPVGSAGTVLPAGTGIDTTNAALNSALSAPAGSAPTPVGALLSCELLVRLAGGQPVIDVRHCLPTTTSTQG